MSAEQSVIHDIGYQRYAGPRLGRRHVFGAQYLHGLRAAFGLGRTAKAKIFPWFVVTVVAGVAVILAAVRSQTGIAALTYAGFADAMSWLVILFVAVVAPELLSRDLRAGVLPLYFSRPLRSGDYVAAKVTALVTAVWLVLGGAQLIMLLGAAFTTETGVSGVWQELLDVLPALAYSLLWAMVFAAISLLVASMTGKRAFAAGGIVAVFLVTTPVVAVLAILPSTTVQELAGLASPMTLIAGVGAWLLPAPDPDISVGSFGPVYAAVALALIAACVFLLMARYRKLAAR